MTAKHISWKGASLLAFIGAWTVLSSPSLAAVSSDTATAAHHMAGATALMMQSAGSNPSDIADQTKMTAAKARLDALLQREYPSLDVIYRDLHAHPELGMQEVRTAAILAKELKKSGFTVTEKVGGTGVVGVMKNGDGPTIFVRADMDGLPMEEKTGLAWSSKARGQFEGRDVPVMHACGHDIHVTWLIGMARALSAMKADWQGTLVLIGQPAEETLNGAKAMLEDGLLTRFPKPDFGFAAHVSPLPAGVIVSKAGAVMASSDSYNVTFHGRGGHGSMPSATIDPIPIAARYVTDVQTVISREKDPQAFGVVTIGAFQAGSAANIIPDQAEVKVNIRAHDKDVRTLLNEGAKRTALAAAQMGKAPEPTVRYLGGTAVLVNDASMAESAHRVLQPLFGPMAQFAPAAMPPASGSEDYSEFVNAGVPSVFFAVGGYDPAVLQSLKAKGEPVPTNHSPFFAPSAEPSIKAGVSAIVLSIIGGVKPAQPNPQPKP